MEENVYVTDYLKKLREEAQKRNIEFEESTYEFIDMFLHYHIDSYDGSLHRVEIEVENVTNNIRLILYTEEKHKIHRECNRIIFTFMQQKRNIFHSNILIFQIFSTNLQCK